MLLLVAGLWWILVIERDHDRRMSAGAAEANAATLTRAFEEHVGRTVRDIDFLMLLLRDEWQADPRRFAGKLSHIQRRFAELAPQVAVIAPGGQVRSGSLGSEFGHLGIPMDAFRQDKGRVVDAIQVSKPMSGRSAGKCSIQFARPIINAEGELEGAVVLSVDPNYFARFYDSVEIGKNGAIAILGDDREFRMRRTGQQAETTCAEARRETEAPLFDAEQPTGSFWGTLAGDDVKRIYAYRRLHDYPLVVAAGLAQDDVFGEYVNRWRMATRWALGGTFLILMGSLAIAWSFWMQDGYRAILLKGRLEVQQANGRLTAQRERLRFVNESLRLLNDIASLTDVSTADKLVTALELGARHLGMSVAVISHISDNQYMLDRALAPPEYKLRAGDAFDLECTFASLALARNGVVAIRQVSQSPHAKKDCCGALKFESYIGVPITVQDEVYGTLDFGSPEPYERDFDEGDQEFVGLLGRWVSSILTIDHSNQELRRLATTDFLTGAWNRRQFMVLASQEWGLTRRYGRPLSMLMIDIDHFKRINDTHGHAVGDIALVEVAKICRATLRDSDIFGRLGGEEFAVGLTETDARRGCEAAERLRQAIANHAIPLTSGAMLKMTISVGVAAVDASDAGVDTALSRADQALYRAKNEGRNRIALFAAETVPAG